MSEPNADGSGGPDPQLGDDPQARSAPPRNEPPRAHEPVWTFRGYEMRPSEFNTAMVHYYRAEITRSNTWRIRLDTTTNWAVVATGAAISIAFANPDTHFGVIILDALLVCLFLWMEARRYRYYELWSLRTRLMETDFFAAMLVPPFAPHPGWDDELAETLLHPTFPITRWEAIGRRLRRNYLWIFFILTAALIGKLILHPTTAHTWAEFVAHAALGPIGGEIILIVLAAAIVGLIAVALATLPLNEASGEILPKYHIPLVEDLWPTAERNGGPSSGPSNWMQAFRPGRKRQQLVALVVASDPQAVADRVLKEMRRGVTALHGRGMYMRQERDMLIIALTVTEINHLKAILRAVDPKAFVTVVPAQEIVGEGFVPLEET
jgi:uncharacterized membrane protein